jgi:hypothetical protein
MQDAETFSAMEGTIDGGPMVAMIRDGLRDYRPKESTPWFLGFSTPLANTTPEGLPTTDEADALNQWDDLLDREITSQCNSIFVGRVTWKGNRELLYYTDDPRPIIPRIQELSSRGTLRPFAFRYEKDPTWSNVRIYLR